MRSDAEEKLEVAKAWADACAKANHVTEFPSVPGERQSEELRDTQNHVIRAITKALGFMAETFWASLEGERLRLLIADAIESAYHVGLDDGKAAHYKTLGKNQDVFIGEFLSGLIRNATKEA